MRSVGVILDQLSESPRYESLHPGFTRAFAYLRAINGTEAFGRHELDGDRCFAIVQSYRTKPVEEAIFEAHRKYIDIQFILRGSETMLWAPLSAMDPSAAYDEAKDVTLWPPTANPNAIRLGAGLFTIFFPTDVHAPTLEWDAPAEVFKVVVKIAVNWE